MASIKESNQRIAAMLKGGKHFSHAMSEEFRVFLLQKGYADLWDMPICPHCEGLGYWDKDGSAYCDKHGHISPPVMTFGPYYEAGYHIDRIAHPDAPVVVDQELVLPDQVVTVYGGEAGLEDEDKVIKTVIPDEPT